MKKKYIILIASALVTVVAVFVVLNPLGFGVANNLTPGGNSTPGDNSTVEPPSATWISPGKIIVGNLSYNEEFEYELQIHNGGNQTAIFSVDYRHPDWVEAGYAKLPSDIRQWIYIEEKKPSIASGETLNVLISLYVPLGANITGGKFEFWIGVIDQSQTGMIITELAQRWLVTMK
jgi:hypothetical protein